MAGKIGLSSSGTISPTSPASSWRGCTIEAAPSWSTARSTTSRVRVLTPGRPFITRLTVASLTPARWATSRHRTRTAPIEPYLLHVLQGMKETCYVLRRQTGGRLRAGGCRHDPKGDHAHPHVPCPGAVVDREWRARGRGL